MHYNMGEQGSELSFYNI